MSDRELLELAAKAAGIDVEWREWVTSRIAEYKTIKHTSKSGFWSGGKEWNPLEDDGDALRLAVTLGLRIAPPKHKGFGSTAGNMTVFRDGCPYAQTRRAVVMAAAEIGKQMPEPSK